MGDVRDPERDQVAPTPNENRPIQDMVIEDILERKEHGIRKYGTPVQAFNGRSMLQDAYEEVMDLAVYLRGAIEEGKDFDVRSEPYGQYRVVDADGKIYDDNSRSWLDDIYRTMRDGDRLEELYVTTSKRMEWGPLCEHTKVKLVEIDERNKEQAERRKKRAS